MKRAKIVTALIAMVCLFSLIGLPVCAEAGVVTTLVVREKAGVTTANYPLTFGHVFKKGAIPAGEKARVAIGSTVLKTQFDQKSSWPDGSVRHAVISVVLPKVLANQDLTVALENGGSNTNTGEMTRQQILDTGIAATINLIGLSGSGYFGDLTADLRAALISEPLTYWRKGPVCTEVLLTQQLNPSLNAAWEVQAYPGTPYIRISHAIENVNISARGNITYAVDINHGNPASQIFSKTSFQHNHSSRWRKVYWLGAQPPEVEIRYNLPYWVETGMVMPYDTSLAISETTIASEYATWLSKDRDLMGNGSILRTFGATGGRPELGILPKWCALYLLSMDNRMRSIVLGNGEMSGHIPIHFRETDPTKTFFGRVVSIDNRPTVDTDGGTGIPSAIGALTTTWSPDTSHQGSFSYLPYLITGERWFLDETYYWAGWNLARDEYQRSGGGTNQNFSAGKNGSFGSLYNQLRGLAWALRTVSDAAVIAQDDHLEKSYFAGKVQNNIDWLTWGNTGTTGHGLKAARHQRELQDANWPTRQTAPWMQDFLVVTLSDMSRKETVPSAPVLALRNRFGQFTIGRFTNEPDFPRFEGAGYWWPLADSQGDYYSDGDWGKYWRDVATRIGRNPDAPRTNFVGLDYADSYAAIAMGTSAIVSNLDKGKSAYEFLKSNLSYSVWAPLNPTWAFLPPTNVKVVKSLRIVE